MDLIGGYGSSSEEETLVFEVSKPTLLAPPQETNAGEGAAEKVKGKGKGKLLDTAHIEGHNKRRTTSSGRGKKKRKKKKVKLNELVLSSEIQAALARGDTLGDTDSDDGEGTKKKSPRVTNSDGRGELLSLLPQPASEAGADDLLAKSRKRRATTAKNPKVDFAPGEGEGLNGVATASQGEATEGKGKGEDSGRGQSSDEDGGVQDLVVQGGDGYRESDAPAPLFTLPQRLKPQTRQGLVPRVLGGGVNQVEAKTEQGESMEVGRDSTVEAPARVPRLSSASAVEQDPEGDVGHADEAPQPIEGQWQGGWLQGQVQGQEQVQEYMVEQQREQYTTGSSTTQSTGDGVGKVPLQEEQYRGYSGYQGYNHHHQQGHPGGTATAAQFDTGADVGDAIGNYQVGSGKAGRRRDRDMERALAMGNLGALGDKVPTKSLQQGSNDYNPLRQGPMPTVVQRESVNIESSVYNPTTGKIMTTSAPTSTQKRKHQINQLAFQAANRERELMEMRGASSLTKSQTQAKYGW